jgi:hypothetical protein
MIEVLFSPEQLLVEWIGRAFLRGCPIAYVPFSDGSAAKTAVLICVRSAREVVEVTVD